jgi:hypothetical protein
MAIKQIDLVINTSRGEKNVRKLQQVAKQVEKTFGNINKLKINIKTDPAQAALKRLNAQIDIGKAAVNSFMDTNRPNQFARKISTIKEQMGFVRKAFDDASSAIDRQRAATTLLAGNFKALRLESTAFAQASGADPKKTIGSVSARLKEIEAFPRTILAGNEAMSMLKRMQEMTIVGSEEFLKISRAIGRQLGINANIQSQAARAYKPFTAATAFVTQEQISALGSATLVPPSRRLPAAGQTSSQFLTPTNQQRKVARQRIEDANKVLQKEKQITREVQKQQSIDSKRRKEAFRRLDNIRKIRRGRMQEQFLGAGFPLLFGGGPGAVGGSILGSALAPKGMGFGSQILGSAVGTLLERNLATVQKIGNAVTNLDLSALEDSSIRVNAELDRTIKNLQRIGESEKARKLLSEEVAKQTGTVAGTSENIADNINLLVAEFKEFTSLAATALGIIGVPFVAALTLLLDTVNMILEGFNLITSAIGKAITELIRLIRFLPGGQAILDSIEKKVKSVNEEGVKLTKSAKDIMASLAEQKQNLTERLTLGDQEAAIQKKIRDILAENPELKKKEVEEAVRGIAAVEEQLRQQEKVNQLYKSIGQTIETGIVDAIQGAIDGTKTLGDVARSVFAQIQRSLIQFGVNAFLGGLPGIGNIFKAKGGPVKGGSSYIVGEKGPEMFTPGVSGTITPNHALGGSTNVVVNVDASGSSVEGDEQQGRELGRLISAAVQSEIVQQRRPGGLLA